MQDLRVCIITPLTGWDCCILVCASVNVEHCSDGTIPRHFLMNPGNVHHGYARIDTLPYLCENY